MNELFLGIDTSNYTTSVAVVNGEGDVLANIKRPLPVAAGARGLRQSDAVFAHVKNLPGALDEARTVLAGRRPAAIGVSEKPRAAADSYMPCFLAGVAAAHAAALDGVPVYAFSHQCGHLMAAIHSSGREDLLSRPFGAFHLSGGTTELLRVTGAGTYGFETELCGGTLDLNAGQIVDRVGVALGLPFPAGVPLEALARENTNRLPRFHVAGDGLHVNLSGVENRAVKLYEETGDRALCAAFTIACVIDAVTAMATAYTERFASGTLLFSGGVSGNAMLRESISEKFDAAFASPAFASDNAVGVALLARRRYLEP